MAYSRRTSKDSIQQPSRPHPRRGCVFSIIGVTLLVGGYLLWHIFAFLGIWSELYAWWKFDAAYLQSASINQSEPLVLDLAKEFDLPQVLHTQQEILDAIEAYHREHESYPTTFDLLVPRYIQARPVLNMKHATKWFYSPDERDPQMPRQPGDAPFTYWIEGTYGGSWRLLYCPETLGTCNEIESNKYRVVRVNPSWIWTYIVWG